MATLALALWSNGALQGSEACGPAPVRHTAAPERIVSIDTPDGRIAGTLAGPKDARPAALALLLHGYTGTRDEIPVAGGAGLFARTALAFAERGIATLRIDFRGSGASEGFWAETTFDGQAADAAAARAFLAAQPSFAGVPVTVLGYSQGGLVALRAGAKFDRLALWNPVLDPPATFATIFGPALVARGARQAASGEHEPVDGSGLKPDFFAGVITADPVGWGRTLPVPLFVAAGQEDRLVSDGPLLAQRLAAARHAPTQIMAVAAGHDLGAAGEPALLDAVITCTAAFLLGG